MIVESQSYATTTDRPLQFITYVTQLREYLKAATSSTRQAPTT